MKTAYLSVFFLLAFAFSSALNAQEKDMTGMISKSGSQDDIVKTVVGSTDLTSQVTQAMLENDAARDVFTDQLVSTLAVDEGIANEVIGAILKNPELLNIASKLMKGETPSTDDAGGILKGNK